MNYFGSTALGKLHKKCQDDPKFKVNLTINYADGMTDGGKAAHDAGYDAYMTGCVFAHIMKYKEIDESQKTDGDKPDPNSFKNKPLNYDLPWAV